DRSWIDLVKLKTSFGVTGDQSGAGLYSGYDLYDVNNLNDLPSFAFNTKGNPDLTWESSNQFQIGTEINLFDRLQTTFDYFIKTTDNLLVPKNVGPSLGYRRFTDNDGKLQNSGFEFSVTGQIIDTNDFKIELNVNGALNKNKILEMPIDPSTGKQKIIDITSSYGRAVGRSIFDFYLREFAGVDPDTGISQWYVNYDDKNGNGEYDSKEEIASLTEYQSQNPEATILEDKTTVYANATQRYINKSAIPKVIGAFRLKTAFKGFELSTQFLYQFGGTGYDNIYASLMHNDNPGAYNFHKDILRRWQAPGDLTDVPRLSANADVRVNSPSSRFLTSSDYLALNNLRLGYDFSERLSEKLYIDKLSLWITGDNLWLKSARAGYNPATSETGSSDSYNYAPLSTYAVGLKVEF
ncbi:MAG: TonB-dependent receptor domain-containing protein, partial [Flavobacteriaceae bacterium]